MGCSSVASSSQGGVGAKASSELQQWAVGCSSVGSGLQGAPEAPEALVDLGQACMSQPEDRPTFRDVLDVLTPLRDFICSAMSEQ